MPVSNSLNAELLAQNKTEVGNMIRGDHITFDRRVKTTNIPTSINSFNLPRYGNGIDFPYNLHGLTLGTFPLDTEKKGNVKRQRQTNLTYNCSLHCHSIYCTR